MDCIIHAIGVCNAIIGGIYHCDSLLQLCLVSQIQAAQISYAL